MTGTRTVKLVKTHDLSPKHNYIIVSHPHGILAHGAFINFATEATGFSRIFPSITPCLATLEGIFWIPIVRDYVMSMGICPVSELALKYKLTQKGSGNAVIIVVGGASEALLCRPGASTVYLKNHKGFVKLALKTGWVPRTNTKKAEKLNSSRNINGQHRVNHCTKDMMNDIVTYPVVTGNVSKKPLEGEREKIERNTKTSHIIKKLSEETGFLEKTIYKDEKSVGRKILKTKDLSPSHNYIMGVHPHGLLTFGAFCNFCTEATGFSKTFPGITPHLATLSWFFKIPFIREYLMAKGVCSVSQPAINYLLSHGTGNLLGIVVGGVGEALQSVPNTTTLILQKRKGFVRTALQHGAHLVPTFTFGETEVYDQVLFHEDSWMYKFQSFFRWIFGFYFCVFYGQGFCQDSVGLLPYHKPIVTIVGEPLPLPRVESPSPEMVDKYHELYMDALYKLFEQHKVQHGYSKTQKLLFL
ncbi:acyl-CoA wax alcohol acyltransferase 1 [Cricetulus griseus]